MFFFLTSYAVAYKPPLYTAPGFIAFCIFVDAMVAFDIALSFRVSILDIITGEEVTDPTEIRRRRLRSIGLYIDILTVIPFEVIKHGDLLILISLIKLQKLGRVSKQIENMNVKSNFKLVSPFKLIMP